MIAKIIKSKPGAGPTRSVYHKISGLLAYITQPSKIPHITFRNLIQQSIPQTARVMELTSQLNLRVKNPFLHLVLSFHPDEDPLDEEMLEAAHLLITKLGLDEHQIVCAIHHDRKNAHLHLAINKVHPISGKAWSSSHDYARLERACREIEHRFGWRQDRGRFLWAFEGEEAIPRPDPAWHMRRRARAIGRDKISDGMRRVEKSLGYPVFSNDIPAALRDAVMRAVKKATSWEMFHAQLNTIALIYEPDARGARFTLQGTTESAYACYFGTCCSRKALEARWGDYQPSTLQPSAPSDATVHDAPGTTGSPRAYNWRSILTGTSAWGEAVLTQMFQRSYLRRIYTGLFRAGLHAEDMSMIHANRANLVIDFKNKTALKITAQRQMAIMGSPPLLKKALVLVAREQAWASVRHENLKTKEVSEKILNVDQIARTASPHDLEMRRAFFEAHARHAEFQKEKARHKTELMEKISKNRQFIATLLRKRDIPSLVCRLIGRALISQDRAEFRHKFGAPQAHLYCDIDYYTAQAPRPADTRIDNEQQPAPGGSQRRISGDALLTGSDKTAKPDTRTTEQPDLSQNPPLSQPAAAQSQPKQAPPLGPTPRAPLEADTQPTPGAEPDISSPPEDPEAKQHMLDRETKISTAASDKSEQHATDGVQSSETEEQDELSNPFEYNLDEDLDLQDLKKR